MTGRRKRHFRSSFGIHGSCPFPSQAEGKGIFDICKFCPCSRTSESDLFLLRQRENVVFAVHGIGGALGIILVSFLVDSNIGGAGYADGRNAASQLSVQIQGVLAVLALSVVGTAVIAFVVKALIGLRVESSVEEDGLDISTHGETNSGS